MDTVKKAKFEQRMVLILLVVFVACFVHMLRRLGFIGSKARPAAPTVVGAPTAVPTPAAVQAVEQYRQRLDEVQTSGVGTVIRPPETPAPSAADEPSPLEGRGELEPLPRDPFISLLPSDLPPPAAPAPQGKTAMGRGSGGGPGAGGGEGDVRPPPLTVRGVIVGGQHPQALIDEGVYGVGDLVKGVRIIAIEREGVLVIAPGGTYRLSPDAGAVLVKQEVSP